MLIVQSPVGALYPVPVELRLRAASVYLERAMLADRVGSAEDPVLPRAQPAVYARFHALLAGKAEIRFHAGERIGREARALLERDAHLVVPIELVRREGDQAQGRGRRSIEILPDAGSRRFDGLCLAAVMRRDAGLLIQHGVMAEIHVRKRDRRSGPLLVRQMEHVAAVGSERQLKERSREARSLIDDGKQGAGGDVEAGKRAA